MECRLLELVEVGGQGYGAATLIVCEILHMHIRRDCLKMERTERVNGDEVEVKERIDILPSPLQTVSRMGGMMYGGQAWLEIGNAWGEKDW